MRRKITLLMVVLFMLLNICHYRASLLNRNKSAWQVFEKKIISGTCLIWHNISEDSVDMFFSAEDVDAFCEEMSESFVERVFWSFRLDLSNRYYNADVGKNNFALIATIGAEEASLYNKSLMGMYCLLTVGSDEMLRRKTSLVSKLKTFMLSEIEKEKKSQIKRALNREIKKCASALVNLGRREVLPTNSPRKIVDALFDFEKDQTNDCLFKHKSIQETCGQTSKYVMVYKKWHSKEAVKKEKSLLLKYLNEWIVKTLDDEMFYTMQEFVTSITDKIKNTIDVHAIEVDYALAKYHARTSSEKVWQDFLGASSDGVQKNIIIEGFVKDVQIDVSETVEEYRQIMRSASFFKAADMASLTDMFMFSLKFNLRNRLQILHSGHT